MTEDILDSLAEAGLTPSFAEALRGTAACPASPALAARTCAALAHRRRCERFWHNGLKVAAMLLAVGAIGSLASVDTPKRATDDLSRWVALQRADGTFSRSSARTYVQAFAVSALSQRAGAHPKALSGAVSALVSDQRADGGWANAQITSLNVAALKSAEAAGSSAAGEAYRRGVRYMRRHGLREIGAAAFAQAASTAAARIGRTDDLGLAYPLAVCAHRL